MKTNRNHRYWSVMGEGGGQRQRGEGAGTDE